MMSKRKLEDDLEVEDDDSAKRQRRDSPSTSTSEVPRLQHETEEPEKRVVLKRLFGRYCSIDTQEDQRNNAEDSDDAESDDEDYEYLLNQNEDPLLDSVPANMDPEQLGFLVCAQETLRFLHGRGFTAENPMFMRLRLRLLQGIADIAAA